MICHNCHYEITGPTGSPPGEEWVRLCCWCLKECLGAS